jgi:hypothetical protein
MNLQSNINNLESLIKNHFHKLSIIKTKLNLNDEYEETRIQQERQEDEYKEESENEEDILLEEKIANYNKHMEGIRIREGLKEREEQEREEQEREKQEREKQLYEYERIAKEKFNKEIDDIKIKIKNNLQYNAYYNNLEDQINKKKKYLNDKYFIKNVYSSIYNEYYSSQYKNLTDINNKILFYYEIQEIFELLSTYHITNLDIDKFKITIELNYINDEIELINSLLNTNDKVQIYYLINKIELLDDKLYNIYNKSYEVEDNNMEKYTYFTSFVKFNKYIDDEMYNDIHKTLEKLKNNLQDKL